LGLPFNTQEFRSGQLADYGSKTIYGNYVGSIKETEELLKLAVKNKIRVDTKTYSISDYKLAIEFIKQGKSHERVVLHW